MVEATAQQAVEVVEAPVVGVVLLLAGAEVPLADQVGLVALTCQVLRQCWILWIEAAGITLEKIFNLICM